MKDLYLQAQISKTSETFSRPHRREALWMPVHACLCRDRIIFACTSDSPGAQPEHVLEDVLFHHIESICSADILEQTGKWIVRPTANPLRSELWGLRNLVAFGFGSNRVRDQDSDPFVVESPWNCGIGADRKAAGRPGPDAGGRFLRLRLSCKSEAASASPPHPPAAMREMQIRSDCSKRAGRGGGERGDVAGWGRVRRGGAGRGSRGSVAHTVPESRASFPRRLRTKWHTARPWVGWGAAGAGQTCPIRTSSARATPCAS
jgi:hypothetical protein